MSWFRSLKDRLFGADRPVELVVYVPEETPADEVIYVSGDSPKLGEWSPSGLRLRRTGKGVWQRRVHVPEGQSLEFKVTRGSWEKVERGADGGDIGNHRVEPAEMRDGVVRHRVERWADAC